MSITGITWNTEAVMARYRALKEEYDGLTASRILRFEFCGDGIAQPPQEQCDDGNFTAGDGCSPRCRVQ